MPRYKVTFTDFVDADSISHAINKAQAVNPVVETDSRMQFSVLLTLDHCENVVEEDIVDAVTEGINRNSLGEIIECKILSI